MIALIAAYSKNRVIGKDGKIPWKIKGEQKRFKDLTIGGAVIMGRKTYEEIGKPLPNRKNIIISATKNFTAENCFTVKSLKEALALAEGMDVYISGGCRLYEEAIPIVDKMYITEIDMEFEGDRFFPEFDENAFAVELEETVSGDIPYKYLTYIRK